MNSIVGEMQTELLLMCKVLRSRINFEKISAHRRLYWDYFPAISYLHNRIHLPNADVSNRIRIISGYAETGLLQCALSSSFKERRWTCYRSPTEGSHPWRHIYASGSMRVIAWTGSSVTFRRLILFSVLNLDTLWISLFTKFRLDPRSIVDRNGNFAFWIRRSVGGSSFDIFFKFYECPSFGSWFDRSGIDKNKYFLDLMRNIACFYFWIWLMHIYPTFLRELLVLPLSVNFYHRTTTVLDEFFCSLNSCSDWDCISFLLFCALIKSSSNCAGNGSRIFLLRRKQCKVQSRHVRRGGADLDIGSL